jgi:hypothetical protein
MQLCQLRVIQFPQFINNTLEIPVKTLIYKHQKSQVTLDILLCINEDLLGTLYSIYKKGEWLWVKEKY